MNATTEPRQLVRKMDRQLTRLVCGRRAHKARNYERQHPKTRGVRQSWHESGQTQRRHAWLDNAPVDAIVRRCEREGRAGRMTRNAI